MKTSVVTLQRFINENGNDIEVDGILGNETRSAIDSLSIPSYMKTALKEVGVKEIVGIKHERRVLQYHSVSGGYSSDEVAWCGSYVNWVMKENGYKTVSIPVRAKSWLTFGRSTTVPVLGSIAIKSRDKGGHVCFVIGRSANGKLYCVGGNQNNEVNIKEYDESVFLDFRIPFDNPNERIPLVEYDLDVDKIDSES